MADKKISQLTDGTSFQAGDEAVVNRSGVNYKVDPTVGVVQQADIGTDPNQVPLNQYLGSMAYQDLDAVSITGGTVVVDGLTVDTDTLYVDAANDRVGIGTTSPDYPVTIYDSATTDGQSKTVISFGSTDSGSSARHAGLGYERLSAASGSLLFYTKLGGSLAEKARIDDSGRVGIGTTSPSQALDVVGNIEVSGGVYLGGTGAANLLDDYEEGTWNVTTNGDATGSFAAQSGTYTKIGRTVIAQFYFNTGNNFTSNRIGGLPYVVGLSRGLVVCQTSALTIYANAIVSSSTVAFYSNTNGTTHAPNDGTSNVFFATVIYTV